MEVCTKMGEQVGSTSGLPTDEKKAEAMSDREKWEPVDEVVRRYCSSMVFASQVNSGSVEFHIDRHFRSEPV